MKKLITLLFIGLSFLARSQKEVNTTGISVVGGAGISSVFGSKNFTPKAAYLFGIEKNVHRFSNRSLLNFGIQLSFSGAAYTETVTVEPLTMLKSISDEALVNTGKVNTSYLSMPLLYRYQHENGLFLEAGIQSSFMLGAKDIADSGEKNDAKKYIKFVDIEIPVGIGYWLNERFSLGARAVYGLTNLSSNGAKLHSDNKSLQNFMLCGMLRYQLFAKQ